MSFLEGLEDRARDLVKTAGHRFWAPAGTHAPGGMVRESRFVDTWPMSWLPVWGEGLDADLLWLTTFHRAVDDKVARLLEAAEVSWLTLDIPAGALPIMLGWESANSEMRIVGQSFVWEAALHAAAKTPR